MPVLCQLIEITVMQGLCHTEFNAEGVPAAQIAFYGHLFVIIKMDIFKRAGVHAHPAADTEITVNHNGTRDRMALQCFDRTGFHTKGGLTLKTGGTGNRHLPGINMDPDAGIFRVQPIAALKRTGPFTLPAAKATVKININNFHFISR